MRLRRGRGSAARARARRTSIIGLDGRREDSFMGMVFERPGIILLSEGEERVYHLKGGELRRLESLGWGHIGKFFGGCAANRG